ncbi:MAG: hypothetical protein A2268_13870 [Candidatus Raymondbacteria bacterium RifOxyA12_full_50_37]|uniref:Uncharacterized protein n=1 Tax=Candidatus Raymondbacteria bacterium RIFOXYD12_FULL_49_13 TaxID=1817890 RepID=A0A1F7F4Y1_UNCRA|nr:MAG: hypothetical protein A2248_00800 [Candidatus Raymondbacteria bacterium RIFOXYA2_FULL_49_16]OGJ91930.1 MAG: hypothetical protein A2268_13870 [Candidatus Raymondbacteria bacterium RifOxyA12_full_50_37]OGJ92845.1 MAG: hypothetical protein A2487_09740 [Candidatus Raymondbacteria bacterium RifOxyC12_full_50_8]OGJ95476.1 MAG: hypothetical protein A2453_05305 [Candidatus Raymondbacteria bacterium RIFOXYC2_FULL_50_21]OGK01632.1 MAG: hypothetical protein A2519_07310 [Candidatus Raymondbacteria b
METNESVVTKNVRETVIKAAAGIGILKAKVSEKSAPLRNTIKTKTHAIARNIEGKRQKIEFQAGTVTHRAIKTAKDAMVGFKQGVSEVRSRKKL